MRTMLLKVSNISIRRYNPGQELLLNPGATAEPESDAQPEDKIVVTFNRTEDDASGRTPFFDDYADVHVLIKPGELVPAIGAQYRLTLEEVK